MKKDFDLLVVDFHGEITSEKNAIGHLFDGKATLSGWNPYSYSNK